MATPPNPPPHSDEDDINMSFTPPAEVNPRIFIGRILIGILLVVFFGFIWITQGFLAVLLVIVLLVIATASFVYMAWQLAKHDILWTIVGLGQIKTVDSGEWNPVLTLGNLPGHHIKNPTSQNVFEVEVVEGEAHKTFLEKQYGMYWFGLPPRKVHDLKFNHERMNQRANKDTPPDQWVIRDATPTTTKFLLWEIPHTITITGVDFRDQFQGDILLDFRSRVRYPLISLYVRRGFFLDYAKRYFESGALEQLRKLTWVNFSANTNKQSDGDLMKGILKTINCIVPADATVGLSASSGIEVFDGFISRWEPDYEQKKALKAQETAKLEGQAKTESATQAVLQAEQEAKKKQIEAQATLLAAQTTAEGQNAVFRGLLKMIFAEAKLYGQEISFSDALQRATELSVATKMSDKESPITATGAGINIGVNPTPRKN